jgi:RNA polymerase sigma-54 factor
VLSGKWLLKNICQRNDTLHKIAEQLLERQKEFLSSPEGKLVPLTMKSVAEAIEVHESTVARAVANKYVECPRGLLPLRKFFTNALIDRAGDEVSSSTVKDALREILDQEDKAKPLSDDALSKHLNERGINCARRTVAKYRTQFGIGNASQRKVWKGS